MGTTYHGVNGAQGGNIFKDVKFWVAQRVPLRSTWIDYIKENGGSVVPLEKHADMLIADHKRLDTPPGAYSWKFIEDSVRNGIIQIKDKYRIGPDPDLPRPVGAKHGAKTTRTPFTKDDDANLAKWVLSRRSQQQQGNAIYQEYEAINPRHTWQSWRDRFVKRLQPRGMAALERLAAEAPEADVSEPAAPPEPSPRAATEERQTVQQPEPQAARVPAEPQDARRSEPQSIQRPRTQPETVPESAPERSQSQTRPASVVSQDDPKRQLFYEDLNDFKTASKADIKERLNINGRTIDLFDLAMAIDDSQADSQMYDWYRVAERLGFDDPDEDTATQLQVCFDEHLSEFVAAMASFEDEDNVEPEAQGPEDDPFEQDVPEQASSQWPASYVPSSPPVVIGRKRSTGQRQLSTGHGTKRPRYDKDMVIPSTPDADLDAELPAVEHSPSARKSSQWRGYIDESEASQHLPPLPPLQAESQDLGTGQSPITEPRRESLAAAQEYPRGELDPTPIPFSLKRPREQRVSTGRQARAEQPRRSRESSSRNGVPRQPPEQAISAARPEPTTQAVPRRSLPTSFTSSHSTSRQTTTAPPRTETTPRNNPPPGTNQTDSIDANRREIQKWTTYYENRGFPRDIVVEALKRTTLTPGTLALQVMESLQAGRGVPSRHEGIWTDRDDDDLAFVSMVDFTQSPTSTSEEMQQQRAQKAHNRLIKKHTFQRFELRKEFLQAQANQGHSKE
ncbi:DNA-binding protein RAP1 [Fusarium sp. LHS14.1]|nr:DNA-binding protein RAP1 [Fusarium sp. LHS14.1]